MNQRCRALPCVCRLALSLLLTFPICAALAAGDVAGWIEKDSATQSIPIGAFRLVRADKSIDYNEAGLLACDRLTLLDDKVTVRVRLSSNLRMQLDARSPERQIEIPCDERGIAAELAAALRALSGNSEQRKARVAVLTRELPPLNVPVLVALRTNVVSGRRALYLAWTGGEGPFSVQVLNATERRELVSQADIAGHSVRLPAVQFGPGNYTIWIRNRAGHRIEGARDDGVVVVSEVDLPTMPEVLQTSALSDEARTLFYADHLAGQDDGRWTLEALQRVANLSTRSPAVRQWLERYGGSD